MFKVYTGIILYDCKQEALYLPKMKFITLKS